MRVRTRVYVAVIGMIAAIITAVVFLVAPASVTGSWTALAVLTALAVAADMLSFVLPQSASGSIAFIPYFAMAVINPAWTTIVVVATVRLLTEAAARRAPTKAIFNISQQTLAVSATIAVYVALGGVSLLAIGDVLSLTHVTREAGVAALLAFACGLLLNNLVVAGVIAIEAGKSIWRVWFQNTGSMIVLDLLTAPLVLFFAWVYVAFGWLAAATLWVPILGLRQVHKTNLELERTNEELLELMVKSIEARDPYTSGHSRRVQHYSVVIARALLLSERVVEQVGQSALLHDVGKIHEKYAKVLSKTEKLTPDEWALIQEHSVDGANLIATMTRLREIVPAIRHHHENWDGTGYPNGLAGDLIPLAARIIRFADTIDAMTSQRPYRAPLTEPQVRSEVVRCRGTQFDPSIADRLLSSPLWFSLFASASTYSETVARAPFAVISPRRQYGRASVRSS